MPTQGRAEAVKSAIEEHADELYSYLKYLVGEKYVYNVYMRAGVHIYDSLGVDAERISMFRVATACAWASAGSFLQAKEHLELLIPFKERAALLLARMGFKAGEIATILSVSHDDFWRLFTAGQSAYAALLAAQTDHHFAQEVVHAG